MKKETAKAKASAFLLNMGIPSHCMAIKAVRPATEIRVVFGGQEHIIRLRSGITEGELDLELGRLQGLYNQRVRDGQSDLEDFTEKTLEPAE